MQTDSLIERLVNELKPERLRTVWAYAIALIALGVVELGLFLALGQARPDMPMAIHYHSGGSLLVLASSLWSAAPLPSCRSTRCACRAAACAGLLP
jgi:hypothetical protein